MTIAGKVWGTTEVVLANPTVEVHRLVIEPWHRCSLHVHDRKSNAFIVTKGKLYIDVVKNDYELTDTTVLLPGMPAAVAKPGEHHRFRTGEEGCEGFELYYLEPLADDIRRKGCGGPIPLEERGTSAH